MDEDREIFNRLISQNAKPEEVKTSLTTVMRMMKAVHGKPVILLIDEYDVPLAKAEAAKDKKFYRQMLDITVCWTRSSASISGLRKMKLRKC